MTEITDLSTTDSSNTDISGESLNGAIANMGRMDNTLQATMGMLARSIRTNVLRWIDGTDSTKRVALDLSGIPTGTTRTLGAPYYSGTLGLVSDIRGYRFGLDLTNDAGDLPNDIAMAAGSAIDSTGVVSMLLAVGLIKRVDATWSAGTNQGGRFYTTLIDGTIYIYLIRNPTTNVVDLGYSDNSTTPTGGASYPAGFTQFALIGGFVRSSSSNGVPYPLPWVSSIITGTPRSATGTSMVFSGIPSWAQRINVMFRSVSLNGSAHIRVQLGDSGGVETTGYVSASSVFGGPTITAAGGLAVYLGNPATSLVGTLTIYRENASTFSWLAGGSLMRDDGFNIVAAGSKSTSAQLDRVVITTDNGTDAFDAGEISVSWE